MGEQINNIRYGDYVKTKEGKFMVTDVKPFTLKVRKVFYEGEGRNGNIGYAEYSIKKKDIIEVDKTGN
jgi:hypothetical protein